MPLVVEEGPLVCGDGIWAACFAPSSDSDESPDPVGSDPLAPQMRWWEVGTCRVRRSGVLRTTGIVTGSKSSMPSPGRATGCPFLLVLSLCYHCKSCVLSKQGWQVTILPDQTLHARLRAWKGLGCQGSGWWPGSWLATNPMVHSAFCLQAKQ